VTTLAHILHDNLWDLRIHLDIFQSSVAQFLYRYKMKELLDRLNLAAKEAAKQMDIKHLRELGNRERLKNQLFPVIILVIG
jgi:hypothetical protein